MTAAADLTVANTILEQLGGRRFMAMTGANTFIGSATGLSFKLPKSKDGANVVRIELTPLDLYDIETVSVRRSKTKGITFTTKTQVSGIYCDVLESTIARITGLATRL
jgi:hypothetical protein